MQFWARAPNNALCEWDTLKHALLIRLVHLLLSYILASKSAEIIILNLISIGRWISHYKTIPLYRLAWPRYSYTRHYITLFPQKSQTTQIRGRRPHYMPLQVGNLGTVSLCINYHNPVPQSLSPTRCFAHVGGNHRLFHAWNVQTQFSSEYNLLLVRGFL